MKLPTLETNLKKLLADLELYRDEYKERRAQSEVAYGKAQAYNYSAGKLRKLLEWHSILKPVTSTPK